MSQQRGVVLLVTLVFAILLSLIGLSLTFSSMKELGTSTEFENHEKALMLADAGFNMTKKVMRGRDMTSLLQTQTVVPRYVPYVSSLWPWDERMPIFPIEARSVDFESSPPIVGTRTIHGFLTPVGGQTTVASSYSGRFFAKLTDNRDEDPFGLADDPLTDRDGRVYLRIVGVYRGLPGEVSTYGSNRKNSVAVVETLIERDMSFDLQSPLSLYGSGASTGFDGNAFKIDGYDHRGMTYDEITRGHSDQGLDAFSGISCLNDDPGAGDAAAAVEAVTESLDHQQANNVEGEGGHPSILDDTEEVRSSANEDAKNVFDPAFLIHFATMAASVADLRYPDGTVLAGGVELGTADEPKITVALGDLDISGQGSGCGIMVVRGTLDIGGAFVYDGVILVLGEGELRLHGANKSFLGGIYVVNVSTGADGAHTFGEPTVTISGRSNFFMKSDSITMGYSLLPLRVLSWREITPEVEPVLASN